MKLNINELLHIFICDPVKGSLTWKVSFNSRIIKGASAGCTRPDGYRVVGIKGKSYLVHRVIYAMCNGRWPEKFLDHVDGNPGNNSITNLREVDAKGNARNVKLTSDNTSTIKGVNMHTCANKWQVRIGDGSKTKYLGLYDDFFEACCVRKSAEVMLGYHPNHGDVR